MITTELLEYIKNAQVQGQTSDAIKSGLVNNGWLPSDVDEAFSHLRTNSFSAQQSPLIATTNNSRKIVLTVLAFLVFAGGAAGFYYRENLQSMPIVRNFFPSELATHTSEELAVPAQTEEESPAVVATTDAGAAIVSSDCKAEIKNRLPNTDFSKYVAIKGRIEFSNTNFPISSMVASSGAIDQDKVKADGTFCVLRSMDVPAAMVSVSSNGKDVLVAMSSIGDAKDVLILSPESTAIFFIDMSYGPYLSYEENKKIIALVKTLPEGKDFIQTVVNIINNAPQGWSVDLLEASIVAKLPAVHAAIKKTPSTVAAPNPVVDAEKSRQEALPFYRDINRIAQIRTLPGGLEFYKSQMGDYPKSFEELKASGLVMIPSDITPPDGKCTVQQNTFTYKYSPGSYAVSFCLGQETTANGVEYSAGVHTLTPSGIK